MNFRKRLKLGPININLSGKGIGASVGIPGARVGVDAKGRKYSAIGIPGTGLSERNYHGSVSQNSASSSHVGGMNTCKCGTAVPKGSRFCTKCGRRLTSGFGKFIGVCLLALLALGALESIIGQINESSQSTSIANSAVEGSSLTDDAERILARCGSPSIDDSTENDDPRPLIPSRKSSTDNINSVSCSLRAIVRGSATRRLTDGNCLA
jgi:hypothetical protein